MWRTLIGVACISLTPVGSFAAFPGVTSLADGRISGIRGHDPLVRVYRGIPYAAPPVGNLRWRPPAEVVRWSGVLSAEHFRPMCPQPLSRDVDIKDLPQSEDCLTLNIWTKARSAAERRPVLLWLYGGAFRGGSANTPRYNGENLAEKGVVLVTVNFRNGIFGFFAHPDLDKESPHGVSGNYMLLDQIAALRWIKQNIAAFGGDPGNVTIFGQSSGAVSVSELVYSPLAKGLFQRAIAETGSVFSIPSNPPWAFFQDRSLVQAEADGIALMQKMGVSAIAELRTKSPQELMAAAPRGPDTYRPVVDGWVLPTDARTMQAEHSYNDVPILVGSNKDETVRPDTPPATVASYTRMAQERLGARADQFLKLLPLSNDADAAADAQTTGAVAWGDYIMGTWARLQAKTGKSKVFLYRFTRNKPTPLADLKVPPALYATHGAEIIYAFDNQNVDAWDWTDVDRRLADRISTYWVNFAKNGDPNGAGVPQWPSVQTAPGKMMELGDHTGAIPVAYPKILAFYGSLGPTPKITRDWMPSSAEKRPEPSGR